MYSLTFPSPIGPLTLAEQEGKITHLFLSGFAPVKTAEKETELLRRAKKQLDEYFASSRKEFTLPLAPAGTEFQQTVWRALQTIPYGETRSYGQIAAQIGNPKASRAVGHANNRNPIAILIPCHRVLGANGALVGYAGGLPVKKKLLKLEQDNLISL